LQAYLAIDTSNPPGNEHRATKLLQDVLDREGIESECIEIAPGRTALYAQVGGTDPDRLPLLLASHSDTVPVEPGTWRYEPFGGEIHDDRVYGRGAVDMKATGVMHLYALVRARREGLALRRP